MANKVSLEVELKSKLEQSKSDLSSLKKEKVFNTPGGEKALTKISGLLQRLESVDLKGLKGPELTKFLNELSKLRSMLDSSSRTLTAYTDAFKKQQDVVNAAVKKLNEQKGLKSEKLKAKKEALSGVNLKGHTYFNKKTDREVTNIDTIVDLMKNSGLEIRGLTGKKAVTAENQKKILENTGLNKYANAFNEYEVAKQNVATQETNVKTEKLTLENISNPKDVHPITEQVQQNSANTERFISQVRQQQDEQDEKDIKETTDAINKQIPVVEKQTSSLGRAFKQFTIYNIALRATKAALREAKQTIQELDKYLTEQAMVTGMTREQTYGLVKSYQELALQCGATTKEIAQVSTEYMKQGKTIEESLVLTEAAVKAAKVARVSVGDSVNYLTTALNGFRLSAEDAMLVSDKFAAVAAASATDYDELAIALSKVASQANLAGMSIDYTTALLTKGLETTREAPETMGTALKTIIARMRELGDYGETLEGDTDINNVESQLAYVGIALRDQQGELRSTEEVLDELGKKWDTLNKNQQAALAKALAGTRQQSRLIALMDDYERVTELQEISQRSAGATAAQAGVYLEGMEASLNKIQVAWEKIVMTLTDSEVIIGIFDYIGSFLDKIGDFLSTDFGIIATLTTISLIGLNIVGNKIEEYKLSQQGLALKKQEEALNLKKLKQQELQKLKESQIQNINLAANKVLNAEAKLETAITNQKRLQQKMAHGIKVSKKEVYEAEMDVLSATNELNAAEKELNLAIKQNGVEGLDYLDIQKQITTETTNLGGLLGGFTGALSGIVSVLGVAFSVVQMIAMVSGLVVKLKDEEYRKTVRNTAATKAQAAAEQIKAAFGMASSASAIPVAGWVIAAAILATLVGIAIATAVSNANKYEKSAEGTAERVNELSTEVYKLNEKAQAIDTITNSFDKLDNKLIKTKADLEEINSLLEQGAETMDNTEVDENDDIGFGAGKNEKEWYNQLSDEQKRLYLTRKQEELNTEISSKREEIKDRFENMTDKERTKILNDNSSNAAIIEAQGALYANNNAELYKQIDYLKETTDLTKDAAQATENLAQSLLEGVSATKAWDFVQHPEKIQRLTESLAQLTIKATNATGKLDDFSAANVLNSEDFNLEDRVEAYTELLTVMEALGDPELLESFKEEYSGFYKFSQMSTQVLQFIDSVNLSTDEINELWGAWETLQKEGVKISQDVWESRFDEYLSILAATQGDVLTATKQVFGDYLDGSEENLNAFITAYGDLVQVGILNMGQNMEKVKNSINSFYEKALEWGEMSDSDKAEFIQDNAELFSDGELLKAFESGNYADIEKALKENKALQDQIATRKKEVAQELLIEEARTGEDRNEAYIAELKRYQAYLNDAENMFKASLEVRLEQEQKQLDEYRSYLEEQQDALEESLEKRKEAYEKYFDAINQEEEDEEYEEQANLLMSNLNKLSSTNNASAEQKTKELENELEQLEKERLKELRERAQEAILENMDDELSEISEKFDKLLESNQALLLAMKGDLDNPGQFISNMITEKISSGATELETESYVDSLKSTYGSVLGDQVDWEVLKETINQLFLNVNGQTINMTSEEEQNVFNVIMNAITGIGKR